jgi:hypothetical protein
MDSSSFCLLVDESDIIQEVGCSDLWAEIKTRQPLAESTDRIWQNPLQVKKSFPLFPFAGTMTFG